MSLRTRSLAYGKSFLRTFSREKQYLTCVKFPFLGSPLLERFNHERQKKKVLQHPAPEQGDFVK